MKPISIEDRLAALERQLEEQELRIIALEDAGAATGPACEHRRPPDYHACGRRPIEAHVVIAAGGPLWWACGPCAREIEGLPGLTVTKCVAAGGSK